MCVTRNLWGHSDKHFIYCTRKIRPCREKFTPRNFPPPNKTLKLHFKWKVESFFSIRVFFHRHWQLKWQEGKRGDYFLFHYSTSTRSQTFRHLFETLHVRWLSHFFNHTACTYCYSTRFTNLSNYYLTHWWCDVDCCLFACRFHFKILLRLFDMGNRSTRIRIDDHPCITSKTIKQ